MKGFFLFCWTIASIFGARAIYITESISNAQELWAYAGMLVLWAAGVCVVLAED